MVKRSRKPDFDAIAAALLQGDQLADVSLLPGPNGKNDTRLICFASHSACLQVLQDDKVFSLRPYDEALKQLDAHNDLKAILGENSSDRTFRVKMLRQASADLVAKLCPINAAEGTRPQDALVDWAERITRQNCKTLLNILRHSKRHQTPFNLVREFIWPLAFMSVRDIVGYRMPQALTLNARGILFARNLDNIRVGKGAWFRPIGDLAAATNMHLGMLTIAGHIVAAGSGGNAILRILARHSLKHFLENYQQPAFYCAPCQSPSLAQTLHDPNFKARTLEAENANVSSHQYDIFVRNTLLEMVIAMGGLMPLAFTRAFQFAFGPELSEAGIDHAAFANAMANPAARNTAFSECLRLNPPVARVFRTATQNTIVAGVNINAGDRIALLLNAAARDENAFPDASKFELNRGTAYLEFGHVLGAHNCFGEHLAKAIFAVMFEELDKVAHPNFTPVADGLRMFAGQLPDDMPWVLKSS